MIQYGAIVDARNGLFIVQDLNISMPLLKKTQSPTIDSVFATFDVSAQSMPSTPSESDMMNFMMVMDTEEPRQQKDIEADIDESEGHQQLMQLLTEFQHIFDVQNTTPATFPPIHVDLKDEYKSKVFYRPEPLRSEREQQIIDENAKKLIIQGKAFINPMSEHQLGQVIVNRKDKEGHIIPGRE
jgi:hypothetical protein